MRKKNTTTEMMKGYIADSLLILLGEKDYSDISIAEITTKAGVNRSTYYRNFDSKDDIVKFYWCRIIDEYLDGIERDITLIAYLQGMFSHFRKYKTELLRIYRSGVAHLILDTLNETFVTGDYTFEQRFGMYYHAGGVYNTFLLWFSDGMKESPEHMSEISTALLPEDFIPALLR